MSRYLTRGVAVAALALGVAACDVLGIGEPDRMCTLIGCNSGVTVQFTQNPGVSYRVEILEGSSNFPAKVQSCTDGAQCPSTVHFIDYRPQGQVRIRVVTERGTITSSPRNLTYVATTPNGPDCPPTCFNALVNMNVPA